MKAVYLKDNNNNKVVTVPYYRIGDLFLTTIATNPSNYLGGKWELFGPGRCLVCVDTSDTDFNAVKKTGGSKYLQKHTHTQKPHIHQFKTNEYNPVSILYDSGPNQWYGVGSFGGYLFSGKTLGITEETAINNSTGSGNSENLQPYITCYVWIRTA